VIRSASAVTVAAHVAVFVIPGPDRMR